MPKVNEDTEITVPIKNLLAVVTVSCIAAWSHFELTQRIHTLERDAERYETHLNRLMEKEEAIEDSLTRLLLLEYQIKALFNGKTSRDAQAP